MTDGILPAVSVRAEIGSRTGDGAGAQSGISGRRAKDLARQAIRIDDSACRKVHRVFKGIRQLSDVAGPVITGQLGHGGGRHGGRVPAQVARVLGNKVVYILGNVLPVFT